MSVTVLSGLGRTSLEALGAIGAVLVVGGRTLGALHTLSGRELLRELVSFGTQSLLLTVAVSVLVGATVVAQTSVYVDAFNGRLLLGWACGYAAIWEFGPLVLGVFLAARVGARNAAELATLSVGGHLEGLRGISLDPFRLLVAPRVVAIVVATTLLSAIAFAIAVYVELLAAYVLLRLPFGVFLDSLMDMLRAADLVGGLCKSMAFGLAIALISTSLGLKAEGGARAVGQATAMAVVYSCGAIFFLDLVLTPTLGQLLE